MLFQYYYINPFLDERTNNLEAQITVFKTYDGEDKEEITEETRCNKNQEIRITL